jgi:hypothetical protein
MAVDYKILSKKYNDYMDFLEYNDLQEDQFRPLSNLGQDARKVFEFCLRLWDGRKIPSIGGTLPSKPGINTDGSYNYSGTSAEDQEFIQKSWLYDGSYLNGYMKEGVDFSDFVDNLVLTKGSGIGHWFFNCLDLSEGAPLAAAALYATGTLNAVPNESGDIAV